MRSRSAKPVCRRSPRSMAALLHHQPGGLEAQFSTPWPAIGRSGVERTAERRGLRCAALASCPSQRRFKIAPPYASARWIRSDFGSSSSSARIATGRRPAVINHQVPGQARRHRAKILFRSSPARGRCRGHPRRGPHRAVDDENASSSTFTFGNEPAIRGADANAWWRGGRRADLLRPGRTRRSRRGDAPDRCKAWRRNLITPGVIDPAIALPPTSGCRNSSGRTAPSRADADRVRMDPPVSDSK